MCIVSTSGVGWESRCFCVSGIPYHADLSSLIVVLPNVCINDMGSKRLGAYNYYSYSLISFTVVSSMDDIP
jgi:hypothetical protein